MDCEVIGRFYKFKHAESIKQYQHDDGDYEKVVSILSFHIISILCLNIENLPICKEKWIQKKEYSTI